MGLQCLAVLPYQTFLLLGIFLLGLQNHHICACTSEDSNLHLMVGILRYRMSLMKAVITIVCLIAVKVQVSNSAAINGTAGECKYKCSSVCIVQYAM